MFPDLEKSISEKYFDKNNPDFDIILFRAFLEVIHLYPYKGTFSNLK